MNITKTTRDNDSLLSRQSSFDKYLCIFCQETSKESLHEVTTANMGEQLLQNGKECNQETLRKRLSLLVPDGNPLSYDIAIDMKYQLSCLMTAKRQSNKISVESSKPLESTARLISEVEILEIIENELYDERDKVLNMNDIQITYISHPEEDISFTNEYRLVATINHSGTLARGHYWAFVKDDLSDSWWKCDDRAVLKVKPSDLNNSSVYVLFFVKN